MDIIINPRQLKLLESIVAPPDFKEKVKGVEDSKKQLETYIESNGEYMLDITNGKTYLVQYLRALSELVGRDYAMCAPVRKNGTYGAFYVKPYASFKRNANNPMHQSANPVKRKPNLYQQMGLNK